MYGNVQTKFNVNFSKIQGKIRKDQAEKQHRLNNFISTT